ncbi:CRISPR-associated protein Cas4 [Desulforamulus ferrireducens]|uniref:CRISPR-associated exonuclease Cas4 n=1 Tax=Desulforamulus ferrireducens TaxID=1833852 RepID=A0A1S6IUG4_9FIRM|nr:CRISPR-associated protein Cas4 [Desulforamulus ferrireducens]AQS58406.1 CRISPR-associated protein Cas4 [Desulforamulus ferrireducens]
MPEREISVSGTLVWYYYICPREVWLISHQINPDQDHDNLSLGRYIGENTYAREKKEIIVGNSKIDVFHTENGKMVIGEVKKSSKYKESARMQLAFYLKELKERGIIARGELRFPKEKAREEVILDDRTERQLDQVKREILRIIYLEKPPQPKRIQFCKKCAYNEFCWS